MIRRYPQSRAYARPPFLCGHGRIPLGSLLRVKLARSASLTDRVHPWPVTWEQLAAELTSPPRVGDKAEAPLWSPAEREGDDPLPAKDRHVVQTHLAVLDCDDRTWADLGAVHTRLASLGLEAVIHATHGAAGLYPARTRFRVVLPLSAPVPRADWPAAWARIAAHFPEADPQCKDVGRRFYLPSTPSYGPHWYAYRIRGTTLALDGLPDTPTAGPSLRVRASDLAGLARSWRASRSDAYRRRLGEALRSVLAGDPYADPGERDEISFQLISDIVRHFPQAEPESLAAHFGPSLALMGPDAPTIEGLAKKARAAVTRMAEAKAATSAPPSEDPRILISSAGSAYYVSPDGKTWRGPYQGDAIDVAIREILPAEALRDCDGKRLPRPEIVARYGTRIDDHFYVLGSERSVYDGHTFQEAAAALRKIEPKCSELAASYIRALCDGHEGREADLCTWLAVAPDLREPLAALALLGRRGGGKSLFAECLARLWTPLGPTPAHLAMGDWTGSILTCPLVFADERLPDGGAITGQLREFIQARSHTIRRKYLPDVEARGAIRLVIAANSDSVLGFSEDLTHEDLEAVAERVYVLPITERARAWHTDNPEGAKSLKYGDEFAAHVLWLAQHAAKVKRSRFWISGLARSQTVDTIATRGGTRGEVCRWVVGWLRAPQALRALYPDALGCHLGDRGQILLSLSEVYQQWGLYLPSERRPSLAAVRDALRIVAPRTVGSSQGKRGQWFEASDTKIERWIEDSGWTGDSLDSMKNGYFAILGKAPKQKSDAS